MRVPIQLASAFLMSPASICFIHAIMYGQRRPTDYSYDPRLYFTQLQPAELPSYKVRRGVELGLADLTDAIHWQTYLPDDPDIGEIVRFEAITIADHAKKVTFKGVLPVNLYGFASRIRVDAGLVETLRKLLAIQVPKPADLNRILRLQFNLAVIMAHEMCHAINNATHQKPEPFYKGQSMSDLGWAWENEVFGGYIETCNGQHDGTAPLVVCKFPSQYGIPNPHAGLYMRRSLKGSATYYYVSMDYIANVQSQDKWNKVKSGGFENDLNLLKIPKQVGHREYNRGPVDDTWNKSDSSEGNYEADSDNRVLRF